MPVDSEGNPIQPPPGDSRLPDFKVPEGLNMLPRTGTEQHALEAVQECEQIKDRLAREGCTTSMAVLQRAILMSDDIEQLPGQRQYPKAGEGLMINPFPKPKKSKKKKKKK